MDRNLFKQVLRFFSRLLLVSALIILGDRTIGAVLKKFYFLQKSGVGYRATYAIDSTNAGILVFGSSRANHSYVPEVLEKNLGYNCYNAGRDGNFLLYNYAVFEAVTKRYIPRLVLIDIYPEELNYKTSDYDKLSLLLPYYPTHPEIRHIVDLRSKLEFIKHLSAIYPYNSLILQIAMGNLNFNRERVPDIKGYVPFYRKMEYIKIDSSQVNIVNIDEKKTNALLDMAEVCKRNNIGFILVYSPTYSFTGKSTCNRLLSELCRTHNIRYLDMSNYPVFMNTPAYFADRAHLNDEGARVFSKLLSDKIVSSEGGL
jgi:hypothetical protein